MKMKVGPAVEGDSNFEHGVEMEVSDDLRAWLDKGDQRGTPPANVRAELKRLQQQYNSLRDSPVSPSA
jgi:hypothetical protein